MPNSFLNKKIQKILDSTLEDDQETLDAIKALSSFFDDNTISSRRNLRSTFEKRSLQINKEFLSSFNEVNKIIDNLYETANQINQNCVQVKEKFDKVKSKNQNLLNISNDLQKKVDLTNCKQVLLNKFIEKFQLTNEEQALLNSNKTEDIQVNEYFFKLFDKVKRIHTDAKIILFESNYQTTGIEIMDLMANNLEILYDKLYKWSVKTIRTYNSDNLNNLNRLDSLHSSQYIFKALKLLEERPILFKLCLDEYSTIRRSIVSQNFIEQLTKSTFAKDSYQSINFVTEIMSWVYETVQVERNHLINLFKECSDKLKNLEDDESGDKKNDETSLVNGVNNLEINSTDIKEDHLLSNEEIKLKDYLSFIMESLDEAIKVRLEQILLKETNCISSFNLRNLLKHYNHQLSNLLNKKSKLTQTLAELYLVSSKIFINSLNCYCTFELAKNSNYDFEEISSSLNSTPIISKTNQILKELINSQNYLTKEDKQEIINTILNIIFEPYIQAVETTVLKLNHLEKHIFIINCLNEMYDVLNRTEHATSFKDQLKSLVQENCNNIVLIYSSNSLSSCDLHTLYQTILREQSNQNRQQLAIQPGCYPIALQSCNKKVEHFINQYDNYILAKIMLIKKSETRSRVKQKCLENFMQIYQLIYEEVHSSNGYDEPDKILNIKPDLIKEKFNLE